MKFYRFLLSVATILCLTNNLQAEQLPIRLRVATYNIRHGSNLHGVMDLPRTAEVLCSFDADVIAVQEIDSMAKRSGYISEMEELSKLTLYHQVFGGSIDFDKGKYGVGILSKQRPLHTYRVALPGREEARSLLIAEFENYIFASTHLSLTAADRLASIPIMEQEAAKSEKPFIVAGDLNATPNSEFIQALQQRFYICNNKLQPSFPADKPDHCIDYIAIYKGKHQPHRVGPDNAPMANYRPYADEPAVVVSNQVVEEGVASDHRPLVAELFLPTPAHKLLTTMPYLQDPQPTSMTVMFQTNSVCHCWVEYGTDSLQTQKARTLLDGQEVCFDIENKITLQQLKPNTCYYYRVCAVELLEKKGYENHFGDTIRTAFHSFRTPSDQSSNFQALIFNDLHCNQATFQALRQSVRHINPDFIMFNGDCIPEPSDRQHAIDMIHDLTDAIDGASCPIVFLRGNHEIRNFYSAGMHRLIGYHGDKTYGAFSWGDTRFVMLDCGEDKPDSMAVYAGLNDFTQLRHDQLAFLKQEVTSREFKRAAKRVLVSHIPVFGNGNRYHPSLDLWRKTLTSAPFSVAIGGHTHKFAFHPEGTDGCSYPVIVGDGPKKGTVIVLRKTGKALHVEVYDAKGELILQQEF